MWEVLKICQAFMSQMGDAEWTGVKQRPSHDFGSGGDLRGKGSAASRKEGPVGEAPRTLENF